LEIEVSDDLVYRLRKRAEIRRQIPTRKSVQEGEPDRIADLLEEAANEIEHIREILDISRSVNNTPNGNNIIQ
jgi:vacuolar-type H+-ATPase subunit I/STV1